MGNVALERLSKEDEQNLINDKLILIKHYFTSMSHETSSNAV